MNLTVPEEEAKTALPNRLEYFLRRFFERAGGALDFALRRPLNPQARTDLTALLPQIEQAIEVKLRREGACLIAPNLIELRFDYETYGQLSDSRREFLQRELQASLYEYIVNHRYTTLGKLQVTLAFDVFTRKLTITAAFPAGSPAAAQPVWPAAQPAAETKSCAFVLRALDRHLFGDLQAQLNPGERAGVGRSHDNALCLNDTTVSSFHAAFTLAANGALWLADLGSSNGTFVNGVRLGEGDKVIVRHGDKLGFGEVELRLQLS